MGSCMKKIKSLGTSRKECIKKNLNRNHPNSLLAQRQRLLRYLCNHKCITTIEARKLLDIMSPASRIFELRSEGYEITTEWVTQNTADNISHRIGQYVLLKQSRRLT